MTMARYRHRVSGAVVSRRDDAPDMPADWELMEESKPTRRASTKSDKK